MQANMSHEIEIEETANTLAQKRGIGVDGIRIKYSALFAEGHPLFVAKFDRHATLSPEQIEILTPSKKGANTKQTTVGRSARGAEKADPALLDSSPKKPLMWRAMVFVFLAFLLVIGHAILIWFDMSVLWATPGKIGGGIVFAFIFSGMVLMSEKSEQMAEIRENMLWAVALLEALAIVVHQATFYRSASEAFVAGLGIGYTWALSAVICLCSIGATVFYQKVIK
jgi:hypothetical protein